MLRVENVRYNIEGHQEVHRGYVDTKIYIYIYSNWRSLGNMVGKTLGVGKVPKKTFEGTMVLKRISDMLEILMF